MDFDRHVTMLGQAARTAHQFEMAVTVVLAKVLGIHLERAHVIASRMGTATALSTIKDLAERSDCCVPPEPVLAWVKRARTANEARNRVIHTPWARDEQGNMTTVLGRGLSITPRTHEELAQDIATMMEVTTAGFAAIGPLDPAADTDT